MFPLFCFFPSPVPQECPRKVPLSYRKPSLFSRHYFTQSPELAIIIVPISSAEKDGMGEFCIYSKTHGKHPVFFDDEDASLVAGRTWCVVKRDKTFYAQTTVRVDGRQTKCYMHNLITGVVGVDHINRNGLDNRRCNLRVCPPQLQVANQGSRGGSSRFKGVDWYKRRRKWRAKIQVRGKWYHLGYFDDELDAARAYDKAAVAFHGAYACPNFPEAFADLFA